MIVFTLTWLLPYLALWRSSTCHGREVRVNPDQDLSMLDRAKDTGNGAVSFILADCAPRGSCYRCISRMALQAPRTSFIMLFLAVDIGVVKCAQ